METTDTANLGDDTRPTKRIRSPPRIYYEYPANEFSTEEERMAQAIANSRTDQCRQPLTVIPFGPTFYPTIEDFSGDPLEYLETIRHEAEKYGIAKIVPPKGWNPPFGLNVDCQKKFQTKDQSIHRLQEGISFGDGKDYTVKEYQKMASDWSKEWKKKHYSLSAKSSDPDIPNETPEGPTEDAKMMTPENLEHDYWEIVETDRCEIDVDYGNDVDTSEFGSGFPMSDRGRALYSANFKADQTNSELPEPEFDTEEYYKETYWNLNNIPNSKNSVLRHLKVGIKGINVPWMYFGCLFSTFCWHNEDNFMNSINYHHKGAPKQWYGVPGTKHDADGVERVFKSYLSKKMRDVPDLLHHITTSFSPRLLKNEGVRVCKLLQHEGEFIVTFPRAFHCGFSLGPNVGEAVNFAVHDWISHAVDANERYRTFGRSSVFSHDRLVYTMAHHVNELRTKQICNDLVKELRRLMKEEILLRQKLIDAGVRDVSNEVELPPNRVDQLDEESANYDDKRLCHSCKHICFFSAVCCKCSDSKVSCLRHSHYMCRCSAKRKFILIWTPESEMIDTISRVEKHGEELDVSNSAPMNNDDLEDAASSSRDRLIHQTYEVSCNPICAVDSCPELIPSDVIAGVSIDPKDLTLLFTDNSDISKSPVHLSKATATITHRDMACKHSSCKT